MPPFAIYLIVEIAPNPTQNHFENTNISDYANKSICILIMELWQRMHCHWSSYVM